MRRSATAELELEVSAGVVSRDGLYVCAHCHQVNHPSQHEIDLAEDAPAGSQVELKCSHCKRWTVRWHAPAADRRRPRDQNGRVLLPPVSQSRAVELFAALRAAVRN